MKRPFKEVLGSVFPSNYHPLDDVRRLQAVLVGQREIGSLRTHPGWKLIREKVGREIEAMETDMAKAAQDPIKNERKLMSLSSLRTAYMGMVALVEIPGERIDETEDLIEKLLTQLKGDNREPAHESEESLG